MRNEKRNCWPKNDSKITLSSLATEKKKYENCLAVIVAHNYTDKPNRLHSQMK